jgi:hypothetical protein
MHVDANLPGQGMPEQNQDNYSSTPSLEIIRQDLNAPPAPDEARDAERSERWIEIANFPPGEIDQQLHERHEQLVAAFDDFAPEVAQLTAEVAGYDVPAQHPSWVGGSGKADGFVVSKNGRDYIVRIPHSDDPDPALVDIHTKQLIRGLGVPHLEQISAISYEQGVTISERMPGQDLERITPEQLSHVTDDQLTDLIDTVIRADRNGIFIDPSKANNFFYDSQIGFGIIDYGSKGNPLVEPRTAADMVASLGDVVAGIGGNRSLLSSVEAYARAANASRARLSILGRLRDLCPERFAAPELESIVASYDARISDERQELANYQNPNWVENKLKSDLEKRVAWARDKVNRSGETHRADSDLM